HGAPALRVLMSFPPRRSSDLNLALGLQSVGCRTGLLDADIYGPSIPRLLAITGRPEPVQGRVLRPMEGYGLKVMSMGFLVDEDRSEEHTSELQSRENLVCRLL